MERQVVVYEIPWIIEMIHRKVSEVSHLIIRTDKLEQQIVKKVGGYLLSQKGSSSHRKYIMKLIMREISLAKERYAIQHSDFFSDVSYTDEEGQSLDFEPEDVLANVEVTRLVTEETITLLAQGDRRDHFILNAWTQGYFDDTELSRILADVFPGRATGHRSRIKRFRNECRAKLTAQAI